MSNFYRTQIEFLAKDEDDFMLCFVAGLKRPNGSLSSKCVLHESDIPSNIKYEKSKIVHAECNFDIDNLEFRNWENE